MTCPFGSVSESCVAQRVVRHVLGCAVGREYGRQVSVPVVVVAGGIRLGVGGACDQVVRAAVGVCGGLAECVRHTRQLARVRIGVTGRQAGRAGGARQVEVGVVGRHGNVAERVDYPNQLPIAVVVVLRGGARCVGKRHAPNLVGVGHRIRAAGLRRRRQAADRIVAEVVLRAIGKFDRDQRSLIAALDPP